jgi:hypothetical protein
MEGERTDIDGYGDGAPGTVDYPNVTDGNMDEGDGTDPEDNGGDNGGDDGTDDGTDDE